MNKEYKVGELTSKLLYEENQNEENQNEENQKLYDENKNLKQALKEIRQYCDETIKKVYIYYLDEVIKKVDKALGDNNENHRI